MANLENIDNALAALDQEIDQLAEQVANLKVGDITQEQLDAVAARIESASEKVDAIVEDDSEPHVDNTLPGQQARK